MPMTFDALYTAAALSCLGFDVFSPLVLSLICNAFRYAAQFYRSGSCPSQLLQLPQPESLSHQTQPHHHRAVATAGTAGAGGSQRLRHKEHPNVVVTNFGLSGRFVSSIFLIVY